MKKLDLILDVESSDLFGDPIAVGVVVMDGTTIVDYMGCRTLFMPPISFWVKENVVPATQALPETNTMHYDFLAFYRKYKGANVWSDVNFPVETNFLFRIFQDLPDESPYPLRDIASFLDPDIDRMEYSRETKFMSQKLTKHNPVHDAYMSWMAFQELLS